MQNEKAPSAKVARDIQERTFNFGVRVIKLVGRLPRTIAANALAQQLIRSVLQLARICRKPRPLKAKRILFTRQAFRSKKPAKHITGLNYFKLLSWLKILKFKHSFKKPMSFLLFWAPSSAML